MSNQILLQIKSPSANQITRDELLSRTREDPWNSINARANATVPYSELINNSFRFKRF